MAGLSSVVSTFVPALLSCAALALPASAQVQAEHEQRAQRWIERHNYELGEQPSFEQLLQAGHARIDLGLFEVFLTPDVLADAHWLPHIQESLNGLLDLQCTWVDWVLSDEKQAKQLRAHSKQIKKWVARLGKQSFKGSEEFLGSNLIDVIGAKKKELSASTQFASFMRNQASLSTPNGSGPNSSSPGSDAENASVPRARLVLAPSREDFVELTALMALIDPVQRPYFWVPGTDIWTHIDHEDTRIVALEFGDGSGIYSNSVSMTDRNPAALAQHVAQLGCFALLDCYFGERIEPMLAGGLANDMVISVFGEADTRVDGDLRARSSAARSMFVPGGNPDGGLLPPSNANSRWRAGHGKGYFVSLLKQAQSKGRSEARASWQKLAGFELRSESGGRMVFHAPMLGRGAAERPAAAFQGDYLEFVRAYRACFLHWLLDEADGSLKNSRRKFSQVMRAMSSEDAPSLPVIFESVYGTALSAQQGEDLFVKRGQPLEGRFLHWLAKQK